MPHLSAGTIALHTMQAAGQQNILHTSMLEGGQDIHLAAH